MTLMEALLKFPPKSLVARRFDNPPEPFEVVGVVFHPALNMATIKLRSLPGKLFAKEFTADPTFYEVYNELHPER